MQVCQSSGEQNASAVLSAIPGDLLSITLIPAAAGCSLIIYDNATAASGTIIAEVTGLANAASTTVTFNVAVRAQKGIYAAVSGSGAKYLAHFALA